jgi:epoxyqueuosine reductase
VAGRAVLTAGAVKAQAASLGFDLCGIAPAVAFSELRLLRAWLDRGYGGSMRYLERSAESRMDPARVLPGARTAIVTGTVYHVDRPRSVERADRTRALVSRYAWSDDYHGVIAGRLRALLTWMRDQAPAPFEARAFVDTGPVQEKALAHHAGLGWIGKHSCVVNPDLGSWFFLSVILSTLELDVDQPAVDQCGTCTRCLDACPTGALCGPRLLDATRCIAYLTIEERGAIPSALRPAIGNRIFGCDVCQDVCPYNEAAPCSASVEWQPRPGLEHPALSTLWRLSDAGLTALVIGTPVARPALAALRRNIAVAIGNAGGLDGGEVLGGPNGAAVPGEAPSQYDRLVREHVAWAMARHRTKGVT